MHTGHDDDAAVRVIAWDTADGVADDAEFSGLQVSWDRVRTRIALVKAS